MRGQLSTVFVVFFICVAADAFAQLPAATVLHSFNGTDGDSPNSPLIRVGPAELWGTTTSGGLWGRGSIFRMTRDGEFTSVYSFLGLGDGAYPLGLVLGPDGAVYGTTAALGDTFGTFFRIAPSGAMTTLFVFRNSLVGGQPGPLMVTRDGKMFGMTSVGGPGGFGAVFQADPSGALTVVHAFSADDQPGYLTDPMVEAVDGSLWGGTGAAPPQGRGFVFKLTRIGEFNRFSVPGIALFDWMARLVAARDGSLYGTRHQEGFPNHNDSMAHISASGEITVDTQLLPDVRFWAEATDGTLFATAGDKILRVASDFSYTLLSSTPTPSFDYPTLMDGLDGYVYGTTSSVWPSSNGTVFRAPSSIAARRAVGNDFDGDRHADVSVFRPADGSWWIGGSAAGVTNVVGFVGDVGGVPVPADYDGDGRTDAALFYPSFGGAWTIHSSGLSVFLTETLGAPGDIPVPGDFDGDARADIAVYRPSTGHWYNTNPAFDAQWGIPGDIPIPADYDGDGKTDVAVYRPSTTTWWILPSSTHVPVTYVWGAAGDVPVPADYDGDGKADLAVFTPSGYWFILKSSTNYATWDAIAFGQPGDIPLASLPRQNLP